MRATRARFRTPTCLLCMEHACHPHSQSLSRLTQTSSSSTTSPLYPSSTSNSVKRHASRLPTLYQSVRLTQSRLFSTSSLAFAEAESDAKKRKIDMEQFPPERIRNLSIIAHIDHGKSTLADRLLQMTNTLPPTSSPQFLDKLKVERERGITVKAQTVSIIHTHSDGHKYLINLIDTPGHVDFSYEVSRSLGACEGGLLLVDCTQGIQAQTLSVFHHAVEADLTLLPVINKVDLPHASPKTTSEQIESSLGLPQSTHMHISAKSGLGVDKVLSNIIEGLPPPQQDDRDTRLRALVFDTFYDRFRGVVSLVRLFSGSLRKGDKVKFLQAGRKYDVLDVGIYNPEEVQVDELRAGQVGYLVCNMKNSDEAHIGDTLCLADRLVDPLPGFKPMKAMVFAGVFPMESADFPQLEESIERVSKQVGDLELIIQLTLNDRSVSVERESSAALGQGYRLGFLGTLHMDVFRQRLEDEYASNVIVTAPTVPYKVVYHGDKEVYISNPAEFPDVTDSKSRVIRVEEPMVNATIFVPSDYIGEMMDLCARYRGVQQEYKFLDGTDRAILRYSLPLSEIVTDFFSELKSSSSGFASFDYEEAGYEPSDLVRLNMMLNGKPVDALAMIVHKSVAANVGRSWTKKLKEVLPRQLFELAIQAAIGHKVVARETLSAARKDVTAGLYGGHYERKLKHLNKQKEGKKRLKRLAGNIDIPQSAFFEVLSSRPKSYSTWASNRHVLEQTPSLGSFLRSLSTVSVLDQPSLDPAIIMKNLPATCNKSTTTSPTPQIVAPSNNSNIAPMERSKILSTLYRQTSRTDKVKSEEIYDNFTKLYLSSPIQQFTPIELSVIASSMRKLDKQSGRQRVKASERMNTIFNVLQETPGGESALKSLSLVRLSSLRTRKHVSRNDIIAADRIAMNFYRVIPNDKVGKKRYRASINYMLHLCALGGDSKRFEKWWNRLNRDNWELDTPALLARLILLDRQRNVEEIISFVKELDIESLENPIFLINYAILALARHDAWDWVGSIYSSIQPQSNDRLSSLNILPSPFLLNNLKDKVRPSRITYSVLIDVLSYRGDLNGALSCLSEMVEKGFEPGVEQYGSLFRGFARYTPIRSGSSGEDVKGKVSNVFPIFLDFQNQMIRVGNTEVGQTERNNKESLEASRKARSGLGSSFSLTEIWDRDRGVFTSNWSTNNPWTLEALNDVLTSFLNLSPGSNEISKQSNNNKDGHDSRLGQICQRGYQHQRQNIQTNSRLAPSPKVVFNILLSYARATNVDVLVLRQVWRALESKFDVEEKEMEGEIGGAEQWEGWRLDSRLVRLRQAIFEENEELKG